MRERPVTQFKGLWGVLGRLERPNSLKGIDAKVFYDQILKLQKAKEDFEGRLSSLKTEEVLDSPIRLEDFQTFTESLKLLATKTTDPEKQAAICRKLIQKIEVSQDGITIHYHIGESHYRDEFGRARDSGLGSECNLLKTNKKGPEDKASAFISKPLEKYKNREKWRQAVRGSNSLTIGSERRT